LRTGPLKVLLVDVVLLVFAYYVQEDLDWRSSYAAFRGYSPTTHYSLLIRTFQMVGGGVPLQSPPTLDWIQVVILILIVVNVSYLYGVLRNHSKARPPTP
jgi:hypothetical protein